jgi:flagellar hook-associated protein 3 FlgL
MFPTINPSETLFLSNLQQIENRASTAQQQLTSGLKVSVASDDPGEVPTILELRSQIAGVQQTQENFSTVSPDVDSAESSIQQAIQLLDTATTLATEAAGSTSSASQRADIAPQVQSILEQLVSLSQTSVSGNYIFSGDESQQEAYTLDLSNGNGVQQLITPGAPGQIDDANGVPFSIGLTAQQIFDDRNSDGSYASDNVFAAVTGLLNSLQNNDDNGIQQALTNLQAASQHLNDESSFYGAAADQITNSNNSASQTLTQLQQQLSNEEDADAVQSSLNLQAAQTDEQAALSSEAQLKPQSLFDYLG